MRSACVILQLRTKLVCDLFVNRVDNFLTRKHEDLSIDVILVLAHVLATINELNDNVSDSVLPQSTQSDMMKRGGHWMSSFGGQVAGCPLHLAPRRCGPRLALHQRFPFPEARRRIYGLNHRAVLQNLLAKS